VRPSVDAAAGTGSSEAPSFGGSSTGAGGSSVAGVAGGLTSAAGQAASAGQSGAPSAGAPNLVTLGCPDPAGNTAACPNLSADLDFSGAAENQGSPWVEPLQIPQFGSRPPGYYPSGPAVDPALWDRSALPAGACVFRLHGVPGSCLRPGRIYLGSCAELADGGPTIVPGDFYENNTCAQGIAPGCPTADPWSSYGFWWYMVPRGADTDLVMCAPECAGELQPSSEGCLSL
jgi:hypothetical protein